MIIINELTHIWTLSNIATSIVQINLEICPKYAKYHFVLHGVIKGLEYL